MSQKLNPSTQQGTVIIILGPTGTGKTGLSILLGKSLDTEIISADSMQIYRFMDIGTAKPSPDEQKEVRHHLISILDPGESFSAGRFKKMALRTIDNLLNKNKIPVIVGGTGLYISTLTRGLFEGPEADWNLREKLVQEEKRFGKGHLYKALKKIDLPAADKINPNDLRRTVRALEVSMRAGKTISESHIQTTRPQKYRYIKVGLFRERGELYKLIEERVDTMMESGLVDETARLLQMNPGRTPLQSLGYKEIQLYINNSISIDEAVRLIKKRTKMYAKRQVTWFKKEPYIQWVDITGIVDRDNIFTKVLSEVEILKELIYGKEKSL
ncbi:tRNA (adenosine(37)-N6)-dimethylallyltransferase MiaA [bacterium]|nr:MAG: tRNA (adenosine(37)-N6)-dimethylallyltransferase MiaA [bacterium]